MRRSRGSKVYQSNQANITHYADLHNGFLRSGASNPSRLYAALCALSHASEKYLACFTFHTCYHNVLNKCLQTPRGNTGDRNYQSQGCLLIRCPLIQQMWPKVRLSEALSPFLFLGHPISLQPLFSVCWQNFPRLHQQINETSLNGTLHCPSPPLPDSLTWNYFETQSTNQ